MSWGLRIMLGIDENKYIPKTLLKDIKNAEVGNIISNPTKKGYNKIKITKKLKQKANGTLNLNY